MAQVIVRNLDDEVVEALKRRAAEHGVSVEQELRAIISAAIRPTKDEMIAQMRRIARAIDHPVYDCFYIALAEIDGSAMVTADHRLLERLAGPHWAARVLALDAVTSSGGGG